MLKDVVVNLALDTPPDVAANFAISITAAFDAHLTGIAFLYQPLIPIMAGRHGMPPDLLESLRIQNEKTAKAALARFDEASRRSALSAEAPMVDAPVASAPGLFAGIARRFDLSVIAQPHPEKPALDRLIVEAALFDSGRPVFIVPYIQRAGLKFDRLLVGWDGSRSAARATADAMPNLTRATVIEMVIVASEAVKSDEIPGADIARHLARHAVKAEVKFDRSRRGWCDPVACRRCFRRSARDRRLRTFAPAGIRSRRRDAGDSELHDGSDPDVALTEKEQRVGRKMAM
jgi:hypothetical protein